MPPGAASHGTRMRSAKIQPSRFAHRIGTQSPDCDPRTTTSDPFASVVITVPHGATRQFARAPSVVMIPVDAPGDGVDTER